LDSLSGGTTGWLLAWAAWSLSVVAKAGCDTCRRGKEIDVNAPQWAVASTLPPR